MKQISLTQNRIAIVDDADFDLVSQYKWCYIGGKRVNYALGWDSHKKKNIYMHRLLMGFPKGRMIDHVNGDSLDNRRSNLRIANHSQNAMNKKQHSNSVAKFKGIYFCKRGWVAEIHKEGKRIFQKAFVSDIEAARAYDTKAKEFFGEFAKLNFT